MLLIRNKFELIGNLQSPNGICLSFSIFGRKGNRTEGGFCISCLGVSVVKAKSSIRVFFWRHLAYNHKVLIKGESPSLACYKSL